MIKSRRYFSHNWDMLWPVGWGTELQAEMSRFRFSTMSFEVFVDINLPAALWPWGRLSLKQKWEPGIFPGE